MSVDSEVDDWYNDSEEEEEETIEIFFQDPEEDPPYASILEEQSARGLLRSEDQRRLQRGEFGYGAELAPKPGGVNWTMMLKDGYGWSELLKLLKEYKIVWVSPEEEASAFLFSFSWVGGGPAGGSEVDLAAPVGFTTVGNFAWNKDNLEWDYVVLCARPGREAADAATEAFEAISEMLARQPAGTVFFDNGCSDEDHIDCAASVSMLERFMEKNSKHGCTLVSCLQFSEEQCEALASFRGDGALDVSNCYLEDFGSSLLDAVARNQGPTDLSFDYVSLGGTELRDALRDTSSLRSLQLRNVWKDSGIGESLPQIFEAVGQNCSLTKFSVSGGNDFTENDFETLILSLRKNTTLQELSCRDLIDGLHELEAEELADLAVKRSRLIVDMLKVNKTLRKLDVDQSLLDRQIRQSEIEPILREKAFLPRFKRLLESKEDTDNPRQLLNRLLSHEKLPRSSMMMWHVLTHLVQLDAELLVDKTKPAPTEKASCSPLRADDDVPKKKQKCHP